MHLNGKNSDDSREKTKEMTLCLEHNGKLCLEEEVILTAVSCTVENVFLILLASFFFQTQPPLPTGEIRFQFAQNRRGL